MFETGAGFLRDRLAQHWDGGEPRRPDRTVSGVIGAFRPQDVPDEAWSRVESFVRSAVTAADPPAPLIADHQITVVAQLVLWADRLGIPLEVSVVLSPETIERFIREGLPHLTAGSRVNYRTHLWKVGRAVLGAELFPPRPLAGQRSAVSTPYDDEEITDLWSWARGLPTAPMRRNAQALLAIGFGAGLASEEIQRLVGTDIGLHDGGDVFVDVTGARPRRVPVLRSWAPTVLGFAQQSGPRPYFVPERTRITRRDIIGFIERCPPEDKARFCVQRLRITWLVHHLSVGTHLLVLTEMAGVGAAQIVKYLKYATLAEDQRPEAAIPGTLHLVGDDEGADP